MVDTSHNSMELIKSFNICTVMDPSRLVLDANFVTVSSSVIALSKFRVAYSLPRDRGEGVATGVADEPSRA